VYEQERVKAAPDIEPESTELSDDQADRLRGHYGLERVTGLTIEDDDIEWSREARDAQPPTMTERRGHSRNTPSRTWNDRSEAPRRIRG
jgi:hypothetical protein